MRCPLPSHEDRHPSATVGREDGCEVWYCFTCGVGGDVVRVLMYAFDVSFTKALSMLAREFGIRDTEQPPSRQGYRIKKAEPADWTVTREGKRREGEFLVKQEVYRYTTADGTPLFDVVRYEPKTFRQRRRNPDGSLPDNPWNMDGVDRVLYRMVELSWAKEKGLPVYICEGERDAHAAMEHGLVATCNPGGAGKWQRSYSAYLAGTPCYIVADRDEPGLKHARAVEEDLRSFAPCKIVLPAEGKDLRDHFAAGYGVADLVPLEGRKKKKKSLAWA